MAEIISANPLVKAGPFVTAGEKRTARELQKLPADWIVICNKIFDVGNGRYYELDFIVIANNSIFLLDDKAWWGRIIAGDEIWVQEVNGVSERNPLKKAEFIAKKLVGYLCRTIPQLKNEYGIFVHGGVVLSSAKQLPRTPDGSQVTGAVFLLEDVCQGLIDLDQKDNHPVIKEVRERIRKRLYDLSARPETPKHINDIYIIEDSTVVRPGVRLLRAKLIDWDEPRNLMVYDLSVDPLSSRDKLRLFYMREFKALKDLHATGYVPEVKDPFAWSDDFLVLPIVPPKGKALSAYSPPTSRMKLINELCLAAEAFKVLAMIHQHCVIHRAINPGAIFIQQMSPPFGLVFTHFFAARAGVKSIADSLDALELDDSYIAPELIESYRLAQPQSDVFSLALVFLKRWSGQHLKALRSSVAERVMLPNLQARWPSLPSESIARLTDLFGAIFHPPLDTPRPIPSAVAEQLEEIVRTLE